MVFHFNQQHAIALSLYKTKIKLNNGNLKPEYSKKKKKTEKNTLHKLFISDYIQHTVIIF